MLEEWIKGKLHFLSFHCNASSAVYSSNVLSLKCSLICLIKTLIVFPSLSQASQLGVYRAFVDNYELAVETAEKCCQANTQFAEISEVRKRL